MTLSIEDITQADATSVFSKTFRVPATRHNNDFFENAYEVDGIDFDVTLKNYAEILVDGAEFREGHIRLQKIYRNHDLAAIKFIDEFKINLAMSLSAIINILDPDVFIFGGGVSNEIDFLNEIHSQVSKYVTGKEYEGVFLKPKYGDASGVRGAARLGRTSGL